MSDQRIRLADAERVACKIVEALRPHCSRIQIAGSIRRRRAQVKDIEICVVPAIGGLFGEDPDHQALDAGIGMSVKSGLLASDPELKRDGDKYKRFIVPSLGCALDLFIAMPDNWNILAIRTGSSRFSHLLVTPRSESVLCNNPGEDGLYHYGLRPENVHQDKGYLWRDGVIVPCREEADFFAALGLPLPLDPRHRDLKGVEILRTTIR